MYRLLYAFGNLDVLILILLHIFTTLFNDFALNHYFYTYLQHFLMILLSESLLLHIFTSLFHDFALSIITFTHIYNTFECFGALLEPRTRESEIPGISEKSAGNFCYQFLIKLLLRSWYFSSLGDNSLFRDPGRPLENINY